MVMSVRRLRRAHAGAEPLHTHLAVWGFVDDTTFLTKAGAVGVVYRLRGVDATCLDQEARSQVSLRFGQALRQLDEDCRVYQYLIKDPLVVPPAPGHPQPAVAEALQRWRAFQQVRAAEGCFTYELYTVLLFESWRTGTGLTRASGAWPRLVREVCGQFSVDRLTAALDEGLGRAIGRLHAQADAWAAQVADTLVPERLLKEDVFAFLRRLMNPSPAKAAQVRLRYDTHVDYFTADATVECERDALAIDGHRVKVLVMKELPSHTFAAVLADLLRVPSRCVVCLEWARLPVERIRRELHTRRRHFFNTKVSLLNYLHSDTRPEEMLTDDSAAATVAQLGQALTDLEVHGTVFGACSVSVVLLDTDAPRLDRSVAGVHKAFAAHDGVAFDETYNRLNAWLATMPGNTTHNLRRLTISHEHAADLACLFAPATGTPWSPHLDAASLLTLETDPPGLYDWALHVGDVGHTAVFGSTGSGKSFLLNVLLMHAQQYQPQTFVFDIGGSYERLLTRIGGAVWRVGLRHRTVSINPFALPPTPESRHFLHAFVRLLIQGGTADAWTSRDDRDVVEAIASVEVLDRPQRRLSTLARILPRHLALPLERWVEGGPYGAVFDAVDDTLTIDTVQGFEFEGLEAYPRVLEPLLFYILYRANAAIRADASRSRLKVFVCDEAWRFAQDPTVTAYLVEALKTWRKHNAALLLATQSDQDLGDASLLRAVLDNCPTHVFLANPGLDLAHAQDRFHLTAREAQWIRELRPREQLLLKRPDHTTVLSLRVDDASYPCYATDRRPRAGQKEVPR